VASSLNIAIYLFYFNIMDIKICIQMALFNHLIFPQDFEIPSTKHYLCQILELNNSDEKELTIILETG